MPSELIGCLGVIIFLLVWIAADLRKLVKLVEGKSGANSST